MLLIKKWLEKFHFHKKKVIKKVFHPKIRVHPRRRTHPRRRRAERQQPQRQPEQPQRQPPPQQQPPPEPQDNIYGGQYPENHPYGYPDEF